MAAPQPNPRQSLGLKGLSPEAQGVVKTRKLTGNWDLKRLVRVLAELAQFDDMIVQELKSNLKQIFIWCGATVIILIVCGNLGGAFLLLPVLSAAWVVALFRKRNGLKKMDLIDDFRICLRPALRDLASDLDPEKKIKVEMNLSGPSPDKQTSQLELPPGRFQKLTATVFQDPWCEIRLSLIDGSTAIIKFENCYRKLQRRYRSRSGKTKWKTKWKKECSASATLLPGSPAVWQEKQLEARISPQWEKLKFFDKEGVRGATLEHFWLFKGASDPPSNAPQAREVVGLLLRLHGAMGVPGEAAK